jgi:hypothetical protein
MPFINLTDISSQPLSQAIENFKIRGLASLFTKGEVIDALVGEKLDGQKFVLVMKNQRITADSEIPLAEGEKIAVKVDQIQPKVVLRVLSQDQAEAGRLKEMQPLKEYLLLHRSNPDALKTVITESREVLTPQMWDDLSRNLNKEDLKVLLKSFQEIVFTQSSASEPDFVKEYITKLGLALENNLMKIVKEQVKENRAGMPVSKGETEAAAPDDAGRAKAAADNLKGQLMRLSDDIERLFEKGAVKDEKVLQQLNRLGDFAGRAVKSLESQQVVNVLLQESDNRFMLQIPFQLQGGIRMAEVYIEKDRDAEKKDPGGRAYRVVFFLDMDAIGSVMVDANIREKRINCTMKCETEPVRAFAAAQLPVLEHSLAAQGYKIDFLSCSLEKSIAEEKHQYISGQNFYAEHAVHVIA